MGPGRPDRTKSDEIGQSMGQWNRTKPRALAAQLLSDGRLGDEAIARKADISRSTLSAREFDRSCGLPLAFSLATVGCAKRLYRGVPIRRSRIHPFMKTWRIRAGSRPAPRPGAS